MPGRGFTLHLGQQRAGALRVQQGILHDVINARESSLPHRFDDAAELRAATGSSRRPNPAGRHAARRSAGSLQTVAPSAAASRRNAPSK